MGTASSNSSKVMGDLKEDMEMEEVLSTVAMPGPHQRTNSNPPMGSTALEGVLKSSCFSLPRITWEESLGKRDALSTISKEEVLATFKSIKMLLQGRIVKSPSRVPDKGLKWQNKCFARSLRLAPTILMLVEITLLEVVTKEPTVVAISNSNNRTVVTNNKATGNKDMVNNNTIKEDTDNKVTKPKEMLMDNNNKHLNILPMVEPLHHQLLHPLHPTGKVHRLQMDRFTITINEQERLNGTNQLGCRKVFSVFLLATLCSFCWLRSSLFPLALLLPCAYDAMLFECAVMFV